MNKHLASALLTASVVGAGFTGFSITSAIADDGTADVAQVQAVQEDGERSADHEARRAEKAQALADVIGVSVDDLMAAKEAGQTPAEIAEDNGVSREDLVSALVADKEERLAQAVTDGDLTQEEADEKAADIEERVNAFVDGEGHGHHGPRDGNGPDDGDGADDGAEEPAAEEAPA